MQRDLISKEALGALYDHFEHLDGAHAQIRKFANAAGLSQGKPEWIEYAAGADDTRGRRRRTLLQYFWDVDWTSSWDVARVLRFFELVLATLELGSLESDAILKPLERDGYTFENGQLKPKTFVDSAALENVTSRERLPALRSHLRRIEEGLVNDPAAVVGSAKELIETVCKVILANRNRGTLPDADLSKLAKAAIGCLDLSALGLSTTETNTGQKSVKRLLGSLASVV